MNSAESTHPVQTQGNFLGGVWDTVAQGRIDHPWHKSALNASLNGLPVESGAWIKRSGTQWLGPTYKRMPAVVRPLYADSGHRYAVVLTTDGAAGYAHFFHEDAVLYSASDTVLASSSASGILSILTSTSTGWTVGDQVIFQSVPVTGGAYQNRWLTIATISTTTITLKDDMGVAFAFDGGSVAGATVYRIVRASTGFLGGIETAEIINLGVQTYGGPLKALLTCFGYAPQLISLTAGTPDTIAVSTAAFVDGPYLDPQGTLQTPETGTVSAYSGSITFTPLSTVFVAADVGRHIRLFSQPAAWASGTSYSNGNQVTYNGQWWQYVGGASYAAIAGVIPGTLYTAASGVQVLLWAPLPSAGVWAWGTITAQAGASCTVSLTTNLNSANGATVTTWRLGKYAAGTNPTYPTNGILYEGRLYLGGAREGHVDASMSGTFLTFSPTDTYGNVFDNHGISAVLSSETQDHVTWWSTDRSGLIFGTVAEEYILTGGAQNGPITPTNFLFRRMSSYGGLAARSTTTAGFSTIFTQTGGKMVYEYVTDAFTTAPSGRVLNEFSRGLVDQFYGITEIAYVETPVPIIWHMTGDGLLLSCTYRRFSRFMSSPPDAAGWALHYLSDLRRVAHSLCSLSNPDLSWDNLYITTTTSGAINAAGPANGVELMRPIEPA